MSASLRPSNSSTSVAADNVAASPSDLLQPAVKPASRSGRTKRADLHLSPTDLAAAEDGNQLFLPLIDALHVEIEAERHEAKAKPNIAVGTGVKTGIRGDDLPTHSVIVSFTIDSPNETAAAPRKRELVLAPGLRVDCISAESGVAFSGKIRSVRDGDPRPGKRTVEILTRDPAFDALPTAIIDAVVSEASTAWMTERLRDALRDAIAGESPLPWNASFARALLTENGYRDLPKPAPLPREASLDFSNHLNEEQLTALDIVATEPVTVVTAGPGCGKSLTAAAACRSLLDRDPAHKILIVCPSNAAADAMILSLHNLFHMEPFTHSATTLGLIQRVGGGITEAISPQLRELYVPKATARRVASCTEEAILAVTDVLRNATRVGDSATAETCVEHLSALEHEKSHITEIIAANRRIVVAPASALYLTPFLLSDDSGWDTLVIDEAGACCPAAAAFAAGHARGRVIVCGDAFQLAPIVISSDPAVKVALGRSMLEYMGVAEACLDDSSPRHVCFLSEQHRMASPISDLVSDCFYGGRLRTAPGTDPVGNWMPVDTSGSRIVLIDTRSLVSSPHSIVAAGGNAFNRENIVHAQLISRLLDDMGDDPGSIDKTCAVLTLYRTQCALLRKITSAHNQSVIDGTAHGPLVMQTGTTHAAQGREHDLILWDASDIPRGLRPAFLGGDTLTVRRLLNVAFSRSREHLVIIFNSRVLPNTLPIVREVIAECMRRGVVLRPRSVD